MGVILAWLPGWENGAINTGEQQESIKFMSQKFI